VVVVINAFDYYLFGCHFFLETDHKALIYIFTHLSPRQLRWLNTIAGFDFEIKYLEGRKNFVADGLTGLERFSDIEARKTEQFKINQIYTSTPDIDC
jgi:hypothetical protein